MHSFPPLEAAIINGVAPSSFLLASASMVGSRKSSTKRCTSHVPAASKSEADGGSSFFSAPNNF